MEKTGELVFVQLPAQDAVAGGGHGQEPVAHVHPLAAAIVGPQPGDLALQKGGDVVCGSHRVVHQAAVVVRRVREGVVQGEVPQVGLDKLLGPAVGIQMFLRGLIGDVEHRLALEALLAQEGRQGGQQLAQKARVLWGSRRGVPAEEAAAHPLLPAVDGRGGLGPPLGEEVGHLKALYAAAPGHLEEPLQQGEVKAVALPCFLYAHQLDTGPLRAGFRIQGRGEDGGEHHVQPLFRRGGKVLFPQLPVLFRIDGHAVVGGQAVPVEPLGIDEPLGRQVRPQHPQGERPLHPVPALLQSEGDGVLPGGEALGHLPVHPQGRGEKGAHLHPAPLQGQQGVREQPRLGGEVVFIPAAGIGRQGAGHLPHLKDLDAVLQGGIHRDPHRGHAPAVRLQNRLEGKFLAPQAAHPPKGGGLDPTPQKELFQRRIQCDREHGRSSFPPVQEKPRRQDGPAFFQRAAARRGSVISSSPG